LKIAIAQPTYLPWLGYFDLMDQVDCFVFLDSVQFERRSWQQRNRIKTLSGLQWLTVPVLFHGRLEQRILDVEIREANFWHKHARAIELSYRRATYFDLYFPQLLEIFQTCGGAAKLVDLNLGLINWFCRALALSTKLVRSSETGASGKRCDLLLSLCQHLQADAYLSQLGSAAYLMEELFRFSQAGVQVRFQHYEHPRYKQLFPPFCDYASTLDLLFNEGDRAVEIIRSGRRPSFSPDEVAITVGTEGKP
jgi:WbqC-like protein family